MLQTNGDSRYRKIKILRQARGRSREITLAIFEFITMFDWRDVHEAWSDDEESSAMQVTPSSHERMKLLLEKTRGLERAHQVSFKYGDEGENEEEEEDEIELETFSDDARLEQRDRVKDITMNQIKSEARDLQLAGDLQGIPWERLVKVMSLSLL